ncbi:MIND complex subunit NNF1 NDAI_0K02740 [Naumovozyma dairenensis CBS 421]|uniref:Kinetochore-associated protein n=1 Tax=Naumovozyma dairenensis (strain ATCC 10597 / BCRC 20456 / CBS 421 / NBRC 0211 / NRRL Y-12639) TaxID=1071378 RepID=G0WI54_NAUDC|nr:hypothetical protein NDAI_0K02740 [Naumovozyma dairenensis CBS 421]CCD27465.1 hypothetical protein NDAI_0K02740 [Naumovozyma dairenensis CBS 421]
MHDLYTVWKDSIHINEWKRITKGKVHMTGSQKIRYIRLNQVFNKALNQSLTKLERWDKLSSCFPEYSQTEEGVSNLINCQRQVIEFWRGLCKREFDDILKERNVKVKLDELDDLILEARESLQKQMHDNQDERHTKNNDDDNNHKILLEDLKPEELISLNLYSQRNKTISELNKRLSKLNDINKQLEDELEALLNELQSECDEVKQLSEDNLGGKIINDKPDEILMQGLNDMLLELREKY